jgi:hypothetical protein
VASTDRSDKQKNASDCDMAKNTDNKEYTYNKEKSSVDIIMRKTSLTNLKITITRSIPLQVSIRIVSTSFLTIY